MCMEDIRIGRASRTAVNNVSAPVAVATPICQTEEARISLIISVAGANSVIIAPQGIDPSSAGGILLSNTSTPFRLDLVHYGRLTQMQWNATGVGGTCVVTILEALLEKR